MNEEPQPSAALMPGAAPHPSRRRPRFRVVDLGVVDGNHNVVHAINNAGQYVGSALGEGQTVQAFVSDGTRRGLGTLGGVFSVAHGINNSGHIVGGSLTAANQKFHAFLSMGNVLYDLNELIDRADGWELVQAVGINDQGQIVGIGMLDGEDHVFLLCPARQGRHHKRRQPASVEKEGRKGDA